LQRETFSGRRVLPKFQNAANLFPAEGCRSRLRVRPVGRRHRAAAIVVTAAGVMNREPRRICDRTPVARMRCLPHTARMPLPRRNRQRQRDEVSHQHKQQKNSGSQTMHISGAAGVSPAVVKSAQHRTKSRPVAIECHELDGYRSHPCKASLNGP